MSLSPHSSFRAYLTTGAAFYNSLTTGFRLQSLPLLGKTIQAVNSVPQNNKPKSESRRGHKKQFPVHCACMLMENEK